MPRILAIDYGEKRTGLAVTDELQIIASGLATVPTDSVFQYLTDYFSRENVSKALIGDPRQMDNTPSQSAAAADAFSAKFKASFPQVEVVRVDERFTSKLAMRSLVESGAKKGKRANKALLDEVSATIMLQDYLLRRMI